jgi:beta-lactamase regulating signal transducer with metallopeptidase domain
MIGAPESHEVVTTAARLAGAVLVKPALILGVTWAIALCVRHRSAALRSAVWSTGLVALLVLPLLSLSLPAWAPWQSDRTGERALTDVSRVAAPVTAESVPTTRPLAATPAPSGAVTAPEPGGPGLLALAGLGLIGLWAAGVAFLLGRFLIDVRRARRIVDRASPDPTWDVAEIAGRQTSVPVLVSEEVSLPFSLGTWHPAVVFPAEARRWPLERKRTVLLHELAHIARGDYLVLLLIEIVRAFYWPNPLVWIAARRVALERERACDDAVIRRGTRPEAYASDLLHLARSQVGAPVPVGATTMAGKRGLVERIRSVMSDRIDRTPVRPARQGLAICLAIVAVTPLATLDPTGSPWPIPETPYLVAELGDNPDPFVRQRAAWWLGEHEDRRAVAPLESALRDPDPAVRLTAAWALGEIKDRGTIPALSLALDDPDPLVREMAALALGEIEHPSAVEPLVEAATREIELRAPVAWALGEIRSDEAEEARKRILHRRTDGEVVWTETPRMDPRYHGDVSSAMADLLSEDPATRRQAALSLGRFGVERDYASTEEVVGAVDHLLVALRDPVPEVRAAAVWSLDEINPSRYSRARRVGTRVTS